MTDRESVREAILYGHKTVQLSKALWKAVEKDWQQWIKPYNLNINEHHILWISFHLKGASVSEVSKFGVMHVSTAFNFSKKLEERGLLTFSKKENDKRNTYIELTQAGEDLLLETLENYVPTEHSSFQGALPLKELYGKYPELSELVAIVRQIYGKDYMEIFQRSMENIDKDFYDEHGILKKTRLPTKQQDS
ncbi:HTH-type transcriptional regulator Hpr [Bacillaceae bacterium S4-13-58]